MNRKPGGGNTMKAAKPAVTRRDFIKNCGRCALACALSQGWNLFGALSQAPALTVERGRAGRKASPYFIPLAGGAVQCTLCPHGCEVSPGERGLCRVRENVNGQYTSLVYGNPCAVHVDPIEKKPFFHVLPATLSFSVATAGCNLDCKFCQNWEISQASPDDTQNYDLPPAAVVEAALLSECRSVASTYVEPTIFIEYMLDMGRLARERGLLNVMHSNGFINGPPLKDLCAVLDAACIDLKGFSDDYYRDMTGGRLQPVLDTLKRLREWGVHTEIVNLLVTGKNDTPEAIRALCRWIKAELGADAPLHFTRFMPLYKLKSLEPTPIPTLERAWAIGREEGLHFVYIGNVPGHEAEHTVCPKCHARIIERRGYRILAQRLRDGRCEACGTAIAGIWSAPQKNASRAG